MITAADWSRRRLAGIAVGVLGALGLTIAFGQANDPVDYRPTVWVLVVVVAAVVALLWAGLR